MAQWRYVFMIACILNVVCTTVFTLFGSGEVQPWNNPKEKEPVGDDEKDGDDTLAADAPLKSTA